MVNTITNQHFERQMSLNHIPNMLVLKGKNARNTQSKHLNEITGW